MSQRSCLSIILAAGEGTRMKSAKSKVLHEVAGLPMVAHVAAAASRAGAAELALVVGHGADEVRKAAAKFAPDAEIFVQDRRLGTGHAVLSARSAIERGYDDILVMFGDTPLIEAEALSAARKKLAEGDAVVVVGFRTSKPAGYGRLIEETGSCSPYARRRTPPNRSARSSIAMAASWRLPEDKALALLGQDRQCQRQG